MVTDGKTGFGRAIDEVLYSTVSLAGSFNNWNTQDADFVLTKNKKGDYEISKTFEQLGGAGPKDFKFALDGGKYWVEPVSTVQGRALWRHLCASGHRSGVRFVDISRV